MVGCVKDEVRDGNAGRENQSSSQRRAEGVAPTIPPTSARPRSQAASLLKKKTSLSLFFFFFFPELAADPADSFPAMPLSAHARNNGCVIRNDSLQSTIINVVIHF